MNFKRLGRYIAASVIAISVFVPLILNARLDVARTVDRVDHYVDNHYASVIYVHKPAGDCDDLRAHKHLVRQVTRLLKRMSDSVRYKAAGVGFLVLDQAAGDLNTLPDSYDMLPHAEHQMIILRGGDIEKVIDVADLCVQRDLRDAIEDVIGDFISDRLDEMEEQEKQERREYEKSCRKNTYVYYGGGCGWWPYSYWGCGGYGWGGGCGFGGCGPCLGVGVSVCG